MRRVVALVLFTALLSSCAGSRYAESQKYERLREYRAEDSGYAVLSVGMMKSTPYTSASLGIAELSTGSPGSLYYAPKLLIGDRTPRDFESPASEGTVLVKRLPPGEYEIRSASGLWFAGPNAVTKSMRFNPPIAFSIVAGRVSYLGRYLIGQEGNAVSGTASLQITDAQDQDFAVAKARTPSLDFVGLRSFVQIATFQKP